MMRPGGVVRRPGQCKKASAPAEGPFCVANDKAKSARRQAGTLSVIGKDFHAEWMPWADACKRIFDLVKTWDLVLIELAPKLKSGEVPALIRSIPLFGYGDISTFEDHVFPPEFWNEIRIVPTGKSLQVYDWDHWVGGKRRTGTLPGWWPGARSQYNVFLKRAAVERFWPASSEPKADTAHRRKPGPKPKHDWPIEVAAELIRRIVDSKVSVKNVNVAKLASSLLEWCNEKWRWQPDESEMRRLINQLFRHVIR